MTDFWFAFRIHKDSTYDRRYGALQHEVAVYGSLKWDEPTSFVCLRTASAVDIDTLGRALCEGLSERTDVLIIRQIGSVSSRYFGAPQDQDLFKFFPEAKKL